MKKLFMLLASLTFVSPFATGCAMDGAIEADNPELNTAIEHAFADETFLATIQLLQNKGVDVDLSAATLLHEEGDDQVLKVSFPLTGNGHEELAYELGVDGAAKVVVKEVKLPEETDILGSGLCGSLLYYDNCSYGPWSSGQPCSNGPLYKYDSYTRSIHKYGRKLVYDYTWYSCTWMAMPPDCTAACWK
jgi:hypothetical protein